MLKKIILIFFVCLFIFSSCSTIYKNRSERVAEQVASSIVQGDFEHPFNSSTVPFIFDGEILISMSTVSNLWKGLEKSTFTLHSPVITSITPIDETDYLMFRDSWEMKVFFSEQIPQYAYKAQIEGIEKEMLLLLYRNDDKEIAIMGLMVGNK